MKIKYLRLSKEEKKKIKEEYYASKKGIIVTKHLKNARICASLAIIYSLFLIIEYFVKKTNIFNIVSAIIIIIFGVFSFIYAHSIFIKNINEFVVNKDN